MFRRILRLTLLLFLYPLFLIAQQNYIVDIQQYTADQGLSHNHVYQTFQDHRGLLWLIAGNGLNQFDGRRFKRVLTTSDNDHFRNSEICFEDQAHFLWIKNWREPNKPSFTLYNTITGETTTPEKKHGKPFPKNAYHAALGKNGSIWVCSQQGELFNFNPHNSKITLSRSFPTLFRFLKIDTLRNLIWLNIEEEKTIDDSVISLVDFNGKNIHTSHIHSLQSMFVDKQGVFCYFTIDDFGFISPEGRTRSMPIRQYLPTYVPKTANNFGMASAYDPVLGNYWFLYENAIYVFSPSKGIQSIIDKNNTPKRPTSAFSIFIDKQGIAWFSSIEGLYKISLKPRRFQKLLWKNNQEADNPNEISCRGIYKDEQTGTLYVNAAKCFWSVKGTIASKIMCRDQALFALASDGKRGVWMGCESIYHFNKDTKEVKLLTKMPPGSSLVWSFYQQGDRLWLGSSQGLGFYDVSIRNLQFIDPKLSHPALENAIIHSIQDAGNGQMWLLTEKGLFLFDPQKGILEHYWKEGKGKYFLPSDNLRANYKDKKGNWWLATAEGLLRWHPQQGTTRLFTTKDGFSNNNIYAVYPDDFGFLWLSTDRGIIQFQKKSGKTRAFLQQDGITHQEFNRISHLQVKDGTIYFGSLNGITAFHPRDFVTDFDRSPNIPLILTGAQFFSTASDTLEDAAPNFIKKGLLAYEPRHLYLTLRFALLDYLSSSSTLYEYRIGGLGDRWAPCTGASLQLAGLPYGNYQLEVRAKTVNGLYSSQRLRIPIQVLRPFYFQTWFLVFLRLSLLALVIAFFRYRNQWLKNRKAELEREVAIQTEKIRQDKTIIEQQAAQLIQLDEAKSRFFANITHELRTPLSLILGPINTYLERNELDDEESDLLNLAQKNGESMLQLVNDLLDLSKLEVGKLSIHERPTLLNLKIRQFLQSFGGYAAHKNIQLKLEYHADPYLNLLIDPKLFGLILNNLLSNALKFTARGGSIVVMVKDLVQDIQISIQDNGMGIHPQDLPHVFERYFQTSKQEHALEGGSGIGLALANESSKAMGGRLTVESSWGEGSIFTFLFPKKVAIEAGSSEQVIELDELLKSNDLSKINVAKNKALLDDSLPETVRPIVLIVEDNPDLQQYLKKILENEFLVLHAANGREAGKLLEETIPDLILSDMMMPLMDGFQLLEWLKSNKKYGGIPVIMLTARADLGDKLRALRMGVDDYLLKPFVEAELIARVNNLLQRQALRQDYIRKSEQTANEETMEGSETLALGLSGEEQEWLDQLEIKVLAHLNDPNFTVNDLAKLMLMSRTVFYTEVGRLIGLTPNEYIIEIRLNKAMEILKSSAGQITIKEVAASVGFKDEKYFSRQFKIRFGVLPSQAR